MDRPNEDDRVRIDNPETDPDHDSYHSERGTVVATFSTMPPPFSVTNIRGNLSCGTRDLRPPTG